MRARAARNDIEAELGTWKGGGGKQACTAGGYNGFCSSITRDSLSANGIGAVPPSSCASRTRVGDTSARTLPPAVQPGGGASTDPPTWPRRACSACRHGASGGRLFEDDKCGAAIRPASVNRYCERGPRTPHTVQGQLCVSRNAGGCVVTRRLGLAFVSRAPSSVVQEGGQTCRQARAYNTPTTEERRGYEPTACARRALFVGGGGRGECCTASCARPPRRARTRSDRGPDG